MLEKKKVRTLALYPESLLLGEIKQLISPLDTTGKITSITMLYEDGSKLVFYRVKPDSSSTTLPTTADGWELYLE
jgi:hypothetical protein